MRYALKTPYRDSQRHCCATIDELALRVLRLGDAERTTATCLPQLETRSASRIARLLRSVEISSRVRRVVIAILATSTQFVPTAKL